MIAADYGWVTVELTRMEVLRKRLVRRLTHDMLRLVWKRLRILWIQILIVHRWSFLWQW
jgi:hypothetical protein